MTHPILILDIQFRDVHVLSSDIRTRMNYQVTGKIHFSIVIFLGDSTNFAEWVTFGFMGMSCSNVLPPTWIAFALNWNLPQVSSLIQPGSFTAAQITPPAFMSHPHLKAPKICFQF